MKIVQTAAQKFSITAKFIFSINFVKIYKVIRRILLQFLRNLNLKAEEYVAQPREQNIHLNVKLR